MASITGKDASCIAWLRRYSTRKTIEDSMDLFLEDVPGYRPLLARHNEEGALRSVVARLPTDAYDESQTYKGGWRDSVGLTQAGMRALLEVYHELGGQRFQNLLLETT